MFWIHFEHWTHSFSFSLSQAFILIIIHETIFCSFPVKISYNYWKFFHQFPDIYCHFISVSITTKTFYILIISIVASKIFILIPVVEVVVVVVVVTDTLSVVTVITTAIYKIIHSSICTTKIIILIIDSVRCQKWWSGRKYKDWR